MQSISWNTYFLQNPVFHPFLLYQKTIEKFANWPDINELNKILLSNGSIIANSGLPIQFIEHATEPYESSIYLKGLVPTRKNNWHDFFNAMIWMTFPKIKAVINELQYSSIKNRENISKSRTVIENALTLFDENGAIVVSKNRELLKLLKNFQWEELFWNRREQVLQEMRFFIFGHSLYEKALNPYIGMTASSILLPISKDFLQSNLSDQIKILDTLIAKYFLAYKIKTPQKLSPLPILGIPGWHPNNKTLNFYKNKRYFRPLKLTSELSKGNVNY